jgi:rubredoxin
MVVLRPAYAWTCPECGRDHFCNGVVPEMADDDLATLREEHGIEPGDEGDFVMMPDSVRCDDCGIEFQTAHFKDA